MKHRVNILDYLQLILVSANVWLVALVSTPDLFLSYELPRVLLLRVSCAILFVLLLFRSSGAGPRFPRLPRTVLGRLLLALVAWQLVSFVFSINQMSFVFGDYRKRVGLYTLLMLGVQIWATADLVARRPRLALVGLSLLAPVFTIWNAGQYLILRWPGPLPGDFRFVGTQGQANYLGGFALMALVFAYAGARSGMIARMIPGTGGGARVGRIAVHGWFWSGIIAALPLILASGSRAALALLILVLLFEPVRLLGVRGLIVASWLLIGAGAGLLVFVPGLALTLNRFNMADASDHMHLVIWEAGVRLVLENPLVGYGYGNPIKVFAQGLFAAGQQEPILVDRAHNEAIEVALYIGLPGLALLTAVHLELLRRLFLVRTRLMGRRTGWAILCGVAVLGIVLFWARGMLNISGISHYVFVAFCLGIGAGVLSRAEGSRRSHAAAHASPVPVPRFAPVSLALFLACGVFAQNALAYLADRAFRTYAVTGAYPMLNAAVTLAPFMQVYRVHRVKTVNSRQSLGMTGAQAFPAYFLREKVQLREFYFGMAELNLERRDYFHAAYFIREAIALDPLRHDYARACETLPVEYGWLCQKQDRRATGARGMSKAESARPVANR